MRVRALDRYVFEEWIKAFFIALVATVGILLLEDMYKNFRDFLKEGASLWQFLHYYLLLLPCVAPIVIPISFLLSLLFSLGNLHRHSETTAMRACGLSLFEMTRALWGAGLFLAVVSFVLSAYVLPGAMQKLQDVHLVLRHKTPEACIAARSIKNLTFDNTADHYLWLSHSFNPIVQEASDVNLYFVDAEGVESKRLVANEARYNGKCWELTHGREMSVSASGEVTSCVPFEKQICHGVHTAPSMMYAINKPAKNLSFEELRQLTRAYPNADCGVQARGYWVRYYGMLLSPLGCLFVVAIAIPFSISGVRTNPMVGVSKAFGLFFTFYLLVNTSRLLGEQALVSTFLAAAIPYLLMFGLAYWLYRKMKLL